jgi:hypothetical protein
MGDQEMPIATPPRSKAPLIIAGCCACSAVAVVGFFVVFGVGIFGAIMKATEPAAEATRGFLAKTTAGDVPGAYESFDASLKNELPLEKFREMVEKNPDLFQVDDSTFNNRNNNNERVSLKGTVKNKSGGDRYCLFILVDDHGTWRLVKFKISPEPIPETW